MLCALFEGISGQSRDHGHLVHRSHPYRPRRGHLSVARRQPRHGDPLSLLCCSPSPRSRPPPPPYPPCSVSPQAQRRLFLLPLNAIGVDVIVQCHLLEGCAAPGCRRSETRWHWTVMSSPMAPFARDPCPPLSISLLSTPCNRRALEPAGRRRGAPPPTSAGTLAFSRIACHLPLRDDPPSRRAPSRPTAYLRGGGGAPPASGIETQAAAAGGCAALDVGARRGAAVFVSHTHRRLHPQAPRQFSHHRARAATGWVARHSAPRVWSAYRNQRRAIAPHARSLWSATCWASSGRTGTPGCRSHPAWSAMASRCADAFGRSSRTCVRAASKCRGPGRVA